MKNRKQLLVAGISLFLLLFGVTNASRIPIVGNIIAATRISAYITEVYGEIQAERYADYNPVSSRFSVEFKIDKEVKTIYCDVAGKIYDPYRTETITSQIVEPTSFEKQNEADERQYGNLTCYYEKKSHYEPIVTIGIGIREAKEAFPQSREDMISKMWERFNLYYNLVTDEGKLHIDYVQISYRHYSEKKEDAQDYDDKLYSLRIKSEYGQPITFDDFNDAELTEESK